MVPYAPAWTAVSAVQLGRPDMAYKLMGFVLTFQSRGRYGGFFGGRSESLSGRGVFCFDTTGEIDASTDGSSCLSLCLNCLTPLAADAHPHTLMMMPHRHPIPCLAAAATFACLMTGRVEEARRAGEVFLRLAELSGHERWYFTLDHGGQC